MNSNLVLGYWPIRGLAQPLRFFLYYVGLPFEDKHYHDRSEWFEKDKPAFNSKLANLPYIKDGDQVYFETDALFYVIANKANRLDLLGVDGVQQAKVATARSVIGDIRNNLVGLVYDKANFETRKPQVLEILRKKFDIFEDILGNSQFVAGETLTYVDFCFWEYVDEIRELEPEFLKNNPNIQEYYKRVLEIPQVKTYISSEKYLARPFNNPNYAAWY